MSDQVLSGSDSIMAAIDEIVRKMGGGAVSVGFMEGATYPDGTPVAAVAFWNEYGGPNRPPRPFFRQMIAKESPEWAERLAKALEFTGGDAEKALALMGEDIKGALQESINNFETPGLAESTIAAKGFAKPLIDTAHLLNSIAYVVEP